MKPTFTISPQQELCDEHVRLNFKFKDDLYAAIDALNKKYEDDGLTPCLLEIHNYIEVNISPILQAEYDVNVQRLRRNCEKILSKTARDECIKCRVCKEALGQSADKSLL